MRLTVAALVIWGVLYTFDKTYRSLPQEGFTASDLKRLDPVWLTMAALFYLASLAPAAWFWGKVLFAMGQRPAGWPLARAYLIGHLGKYVPGKAMVVVLRAGLLRGPAVDATAAAVSVFVETLTLMAVGACLASTLLAVLYREHLTLLLLGVAMTLAAGVPTLPPIFRRLVLLFQVKRISPRIEQALSGLDWRLMAWGWILMGLSWCLMGLSLWAVLESIPGVTTNPGDGPLILATVALALVAGFVSFIPGGLGVRELVVIPLLEPLCGHTPAVVSAIALRLIWLLAELAASAMVYLIPGSGVRRPRDAA